MKWCKDCIYKKWYDWNCLVTLVPRLSFSTPIAEYCYRRKWWKLIRLTGTWYKPWTLRIIRIEK